MRSLELQNQELHRSVQEQFIEKFHQVAKKIIIDHPTEFEAEPFMGPLIDENALNMYLNFMGMAKREGYEEVMRGKALNKSKKGYYVSPSIHYIEKIDPESHFMKHELFGPNCCFITYDDIDEAIAIANDTNYGLANAIFTEDQSLWQKAREELESGIININRPSVGASSMLPFGGHKDSGNYHPAGVSMILKAAEQIWLSRSGPLHGWSRICRP